MFESETVLMQRMSILTGDISRLHEEIRRLNEVKVRLEGKEQELSSYTHQLLTPELTTGTWQGKYAHEFEAIREQEVYEEYQHVTSRTFSSYYLQIELAKNFCSSQVESKTQSLRSVQTQLTHLRNNKD